MIKVVGDGVQVDRTKLIRGLDIADVTFQDGFVYGTCPFCGAGRGDGHGLALDLRTETWRCSDCGDKGYLEDLARTFMPIWAVLLGLEGCQFDEYWHYHTEEGLENMRKRCSPERLRAEMIVYDWAAKEHASAEEVAAALRPLDDDARWADDSEEDEEEEDPTEVPPKTLDADALAELTELPECMVRAAGVEDVAGFRSEEGEDVPSGVAFPLTDGNGAAVGWWLVAQDGAMRVLPADFAQSHRSAGGVRGVYVPAGECRRRAVTLCWDVATALVAGSHGQEAVAVPGGELNDALLARVAGRVVEIPVGSDSWSRERAQAAARALAGVAREVVGVRLTDTLGLAQTLSLPRKTPRKYEELRRVDVFAAEPRAADFETTDEGNGALLAALFGDRLRYDHARNAWYVFREGLWWERDVLEERLRYATEAARWRERASLDIKPRAKRERAAEFAVTSRNWARVARALSCARALRPVAATGGEWDADPWLLGCASGVIDLRDGSLREGRPEDGVCRHSDVAYRPQAECPRWEQFLNEVLGGDAELIEFVQRAAGYTLTGLMHERMAFVLWGGDGEAQAAFLGAVRSVLGGYARRVDFATLERGGARGMAGLAGARLVAASEWAEGGRLNAARLRLLTCGDAEDGRPARFRAKLWLGVRHLPAVGDVGDGFWRGMSVVPFGVGCGELDRDLPEQLGAEREGILAWAVRGTAAYRERGLGRPEAVREAVDEYREEADAVGEFLASECVTGSGHRVKAGELYEAYAAWARETGLMAHERLAPRLFGMSMRTRFRRHRTKAGHEYLGVGLGSAQGVGCSMV